MRRLVQEQRHTVEAFRREARVGVEQQHVARRAGEEPAQRKIDPRSEADVRARVDVLRSVPARDVAHLCRARVVDDGHPVGTPELGQAAIESLCTVVRDDDGVDLTSHADASPLCLDQ